MSAGVFTIWKDCKVRKFSLQIELIRYPVREDLSKWNRHKDQMNTLNSQPLKQDIHILPVRIKRTYKPMQGAIPGISPRRDLHVLTDLGRQNSKNFIRLSRIRDLNTWQLTQSPAGHSSSIADPEDTG
jgi:hypothetical protein